MLFSDPLPTSNWVFGYGSLVWRPGFAYEETKLCFIEGFHRRFWQGSADHRGTAQFMGRVVTLIPHDHLRSLDMHDMSIPVCWGAAFRLSDEHREKVLKSLDEREIVWSEGIL